MGTVFFQEVPGDPPRQTYDTPLMISRSVRHRWVDVQLPRGTATRLLTVGWQGLKKNSDLEF